ncbi:MAG: copper amine oxidase N-terminal domain-containing protein [Armatimonadetes bacterium]|nr:copper amine oxidase N-terminal domain-containing protein [Armatimonadota bacterium]
MTRRIIFFSILALSLALFSSNAIAQGGSVHVVVNGELLTFDQPPLISGGSVMVPLRGVFEKLGADVHWEPFYRVVRASRGDTQIELRLGSPTATINGEVKMLATPAMSIRGRTMVPLRFVSEALGADVKWYWATRTVEITGATAGLGPSPLPSASAPRIDTLTHNASAPLHPRDTVIVTMYGEAGAKAMFDISGVAQNVPMQEVAPGHYVGSTQIPDSTQNLSNAPIFGRLSRAGKESLRVATPGVTIQALTAGISRILPEENSLIKTSRPNIMVMFSPSGTARILPSSVRLYLNGTDVTSQAVINENLVTYTPSGNLQAGKNSVFLSATDTQGNSLQKNWNFDVQLGGSIQSVSHSAIRPLAPGETLTVTMVGDPGGTATFDLGTLRTGLTMVESSSGHYVGTYIVQPSDNLMNGYIVGRLAMYGQPSVAVSATTPVSIGSAAAFTVSLTSPGSGVTVGDEFEIVGMTRPFSNVSLNVKARSGGFVQFEGDVLSTTVQANASGQFSHSFKGYLPFSGGTYTITALARDAFGNESQPMTLTVMRR